MLLSVFKHTPGNATVTGALTGLQPLRTMIKHCSSLRSQSVRKTVTVIDMFHNELPLEYIEKHLMRTDKILQDATLVTENSFN